MERFHHAASEVGDEDPYAAYLSGWIGPWKFAAPKETAARLARAGFADVEAWLEPFPVTPDNPAGYLRSVCLGYHLERLPEELRGPYVDAVEQRCGRPLELDYVRLNIDARKPG